MPPSLARRLEQTPVHRVLGSFLDRGLAMASDPANAGLPDLCLRITTTHSHWFARTCRVCFDKFREEDQVRLCPLCQDAFHDDPQHSLHCWQRRFAENDCCRNAGDPRFPALPPCLYRWDGFLPSMTGQTPVAAPLTDKSHPVPPFPLLEQFIAGLESVWQPYGQQTVIKVQRGSELVGRACPWCRFRVRAGDQVVACPCRCGTYFHQDVFRRLECWNAWNGRSGVKYCPSTGRSLPESS